MNTLQKMGLSIGAVALSTLPFFMRMNSAPPLDSLCDVLCRDGYESPCEGDNADSENFYGYQRRTYDVKDKRISVVAYSEKALNFLFLAEVGGPRNSRVFDADGMDLEDVTPQIVGGKKIVKCKIIDESDLSRKDFSPEELKELEEQARTDIKYRAMEKEVVDDVVSNGEMYTPVTRSWISFPTLEKLFPPIKRLFERTVSCRNYKVYPINNSTSMAVLVDLEGSRSGIPRFYHFCNTSDGKIPGYFFSGNNCLTFDNYDSDEQQPTAETAFEDLKEGKRDISHINILIWSSEPPIPRKALEQIVAVIHSK